MSCRISLWSAYSMISVYSVLLGVVITVIMAGRVLLLVRQCNTRPNLQGVKFCYGSICSAIRCSYICSSHQIVLTINQTLNNSQFPINSLTVIVHQYYVCHRLVSSVCCSLSSCGTRVMMSNIRVSILSENIAITMSAV